MLQVLFPSHTISDQVWVNVGLDAAFLCFDPLLQYLLIHQRFLSVMVVGRLCYQLEMVHHRIVASCRNLIANKLEFILLLMMRLVVGYDLFHGAVIG